MIIHCRIFPFITQELKLTADGISEVSDSYTCHSCFGDPDPDGFYTIYIGKLKAVKAIFNAKIESNITGECVFGIASVDKNRWWTGESIDCIEGKKQYDGTYLFTKDIREKDFNDNIQIQKWAGSEYITIIYFTLEFEENRITIDYKSYKNDLDQLKN